MDFFRSSQKSRIEKDYWVVLEMLLLCFDLSGVSRLQWVLINVCAKRAGHSDELTQFLNRIKYSNTPTRKQLFMEYDFFVLLDLSRLNPGTNYMM
jgi:hypothetical protein